MQATDLTKLSIMNIEAIPLEEIALLVAKERYPKLCLQTYRNLLDQFAHEARRRIGGVVGGPAVARGLSHYLFEEEGFRGNRQDYYNPSNSYFNDVLDQRTGIPMTLSILYIAVGRRLQLPLDGVTFPGHFLVRYQQPGSNFYIDAFHRWKLLSKEACKKRLEEKFGDALPYRTEFLQPATHREILIRMLTNLKMCYMIRKKFETVITILNQILMFSEGADELKERGLIYFHLECFAPALRDLEKYLVNKPKAPDREVIETCLTDLRAKVSHIS